MTFNGKIGSGSPIFNFGGPSKTNNAGKPQEVRTSQPIEIVSEKPQISAADLDNLSPYAGLIHLSQKAPVGTVESYMSAAPELAIWNGNFTLSSEGVKELNEVLNTANYICKDQKAVAANLENTNFFNELDQAFGIAT